MHLTFKTEAKLPDTKRITLLIFPNFFVPYPTVLFLILTVMICFFHVLIKLKPCLFEKLFGLCL
jgi:hypothetical protein